MAPVKLAGPDAVRQKRQPWKGPKMVTVRVGAPSALMLCTPPHQQCPNDSGCYISDPCSECVNSC
jgi:hypothetical protein